MGTSGKTQQTGNDGAPKTADESNEGRSFRPGMALRVAIGFAAVALIVLTANFITQQSAAEARYRVRELLLQHEPLVRATETLASAVSLYERVVIDQSESSVVSHQQVAGRGTAA
jgi:hypothetical protein